MADQALQRTLTGKRQRFVEEYLVDLNATQAAIRAGYSAATAEQAGYRLLRNVHIREAVSAKRNAQVKNTDLSAARILEELRRLALVDMRDYFNEDGSAKLPRELTTEQASCLSGFEVLIKNAKAGDGVTDTIYKFKLWDKVKALELLAKHFALLTEVVRVEEQATLELRLVAGRMRVAEARQKRLEAPGSSTA